MELNKSDGTAVSDLAPSLEEYDRCTRVLTMEDAERVSKHLVTAIAKRLPTISGGNHARIPGETKVTYSPSFQPLLAGELKAGCGVMGTVSEYVVLHVVCYNADCTIGRPSLGGHSFRPHKDTGDKATYFGGGLWSAASGACDSNYRLPLIEAKSPKPRCDNIRSTSSFCNCTFAYSPRRVLCRSQEDSCPVRLSVQ